MSLAEVGQGNQLLAVLVDFDRPASAQLPCETQGDIETASVELDLAAIACLVGRRSWQLWARRSTEPISLVPGQQDHRDAQHRPNVGGILSCAHLDEPIEARAIDYAYVAPNRKRPSWSSRDVVSRMRDHCAWARGARSGSAFRTPSYARIPGSRSCAVPNVIDVSSHDMCLNGTLNRTGHWGRISALALQQSVRWPNQEQATGCHVRSQARMSAGVWQSTPSRVPAPRR